jgi:hypothetical protein
MRRYQDATCVSGCSRDRGLAMGISACGWSESTGARDIDRGDPVERDRCCSETSTNDTSSASIKRALSSRLSGKPAPRRGSLPDPAAGGRSMDRQVGYLNARDLCLIAPFSRYTTPFGAELLMNSATKARPISSCSIVPKGPGIKRPNQAA